MPLGKNVSILHICILREMADTLHISVDTKEGNNGRSFVNTGKAFRTITCSVFSPSLRRPGLWPTPLQHRWRTGRTSLLRGYLTSLVVIQPRPKVSKSQQTPGQHSCCNPADTWPAQLLQPGSQQDQPGTLWTPTDAWTKRPSSLRPQWHFDPIKTSTVTFCPCDNVNLVHLV